MTDAPRYGDHPPAVTFFAAGRPVPGGSKRAFPHSATGRMVVIDVSGARVKTWRARVAAAARAAFPGPPLTGPLEVWFDFTIPRPKRHYRTGRFAAMLRDGCEAELPTGPADLTKLVRSTEDSLTNILWTDDALIVRQTATKTYGERPGVAVCVRRVETGANP